MNEKIIDRNTLIIVAKNLISKQATYDNVSNELIKMGFKVEKDLNITNNVIFDSITKQNANYTARFTYHDICISVPTDCNYNITELIEEN